MKRIFHLNVHNSVLKEGDCVLVLKVGPRGKQKLKDIKENRLYNNNI